MSLCTSHGSYNLVIEEDLTVTYSNSIVNGSWGWTSGNASGTYSRMREYHRYARKAFRYVGMTHTAATACKTAMITAFTRTFKTSNWQADAMGGAWVDESAGTILMADVSCVHVDGDCWEVHVRVNEDDVRYRFANQNYSTIIIYADVRQRDYNGEVESSNGETES